MASTRKGGRSFVLSGPPPDLNSPNGNEKSAGNQAPLHHPVEEQQRSTLPAPVGVYEVSNSNQNGKIGHPAPSSTTYVEPDPPQVIFNSDYRTRLGAAASRSQPPPRPASDIPSIGYIKKKNHGRFGERVCCSAPIDIACFSQSLFSTHSGCVQGRGRNIAPL